MIDVRNDITLCLDVMMVGDTHIRRGRVCQGRRGRVKSENQIYKCLFRKVNICFEQLNMCRKVKYLFRNVIYKFTGSSY